MRRRVLLAVLAVLSIVVMGCDLRTTAPPGTAPVRYRDAVFTSVVTTSNITYGSAVNQQGQTVTLKLDSYVPSGDTVTQAPGHRLGARRLVQLGGQDLGRAGRRGHVVRQEGLRERLDQLPPGQRLLGRLTPTAACVTSIVDAQHDAQAAVRFLRANATAYGVDPTRIAVAGTSAGAITALNVGFDSDRPGHERQPRLLVGRPGCGLALGRRLLTTPSSGDAPSLLFHGTADPLVPYQWAVNTQDDATAAGLAVLAHHLDRRRPRPLRRSARPDPDRDHQLPLLDVEPHQRGH